jgi:hypothetical protein
VEVDEQLRGSIGDVLNWLEVASWVHDTIPLIQSYIEPPKTLEELHRAVSTPVLGTQIHHIVEQGPAEKEKFPRSQIDAPDNLVRIPTLNHYEITRWFTKPNKDFGGMPPREYLRGRDWTERRKVGLDALVKFRVLKP